MTTTMKELPPQQQQQHLAGLHTVPEISSHLGVSTSILYNETKAARTQQEPWVQKKYSRSLGRAQWLLDTDSDSFLTLTQGWKHPHLVPLQPSAQMQQEYTIPELPPFPFSEENDEIDESFFAATHSLTVPGASGNGHSFVERTLSRKTVSPPEPWSMLCEWLHTKGLVVFRNALHVCEEEPQWQWQWEALSGNGYFTKSEAILAALAARYQLSEQCPSCTTVFTGKKVKTRNVWFG